MTFVRRAFLDESGRALIARRSGADRLFTCDGYRAFADDLLERMVNPWLRDDVERVTRDARRKLGWDDRLIGAMRLALAAGIKPERLAIGAAAALDKLHDEEPTETKRGLLDQIWRNASASSDEKRKLCSMILNARESGLS
jgi:mannitol-1-phosphate 5-dehydrogenase